MQVMTKAMPVVAMVLALGASQAWAGQRDEHGRDRNGRESQGEARRRAGNAPAARESAPAREHANIAIATSVTDRNGRRLFGGAADSKE